MQIFVKLMDGKTVAFDVSKQEKIYDMKRKIEKKIGLAEDDQRFVFQGWILQDYKTIEECQIVEKSVINVVAKLKYIFYQTLVFSSTHFR